MINLDEYINDGIKVKLNGKEVTVKQLTARLAKEINKLESGINEENSYETRAKVTMKFLNNNVEGVLFTEKDIENIPVKLQTTICSEVSKFVYDLKNNPN